MSPLDRIVVVLHEPQDLVNIAGTARAMMNMGLDQLRLVRPAEFSIRRITGIAHRSEALLERTLHFETLADAVGDAVYVVGTSARHRTEGRNYGRPATLADAILQQTENGTVALVFGREDRGLSNEDLDLCHAIAVVPTAARYSSLNLAQAVLILAYELFSRTTEADRPLPRGRRATHPATRADLEQMYSALRGGLEEMQFFKARKPESVMRTLRTILSQADMDQRESRLLAAIGYEFGHYIRRLRNTLGRPEPLPSPSPDRDDDGEGAGDPPS